MQTEGPYVTAEFYSVQGANNHCIEKDLQEKGGSSGAT